MKPYNLKQVAAVLLCLLISACMPSAADDRALVTEVAATIYAERTAAAEAATVTPALTVAAAMPRATSAPAATPQAKATVTIKAAATVAPTATPTPTPTPSGPRLAKTQELHLSATWLREIDPLQILSRQEDQIVYELFVGLTRQDEETAEVQPAMARSWEVSADGLVWTFDLRQDVPWVNGAGKTVTPVVNGGQTRYVSAPDFEYGLKTLLGPDTPDYAAELLFVIEGARAFHQGESQEVGIEALDDHTLQIRLVEPVSYLDALLSSPLCVARPAWQIETHGDEWTEAANLHSYGPYALQGWLPDEYVVLVANPHWPGIESIPQPTVEVIDWQVMTADKAWLAFMAGTLDVAELGSDLPDAVRGDPRLVQQPDACTQFAAFNTSRPPFDVPAVRQAFSLALDREALVAAGETYEPAFYFTPPGLRAAPSTAGGGLYAAPDRAQALLDELYPDRAALPAIKLGILDTPLYSRTGETLREQWADALGVEVEVTPLEWGDFFDALDAGTLHMWMLTRCSSTCADAGLHLETTFGPQGDLAGRSKWSSAALEVLLKAATRTDDVAQRAALYAQAEELLIGEEAVVIPLGWYTPGVLCQPYVERTFATIQGLEHLEKWRVLAADSAAPTPRPTRTPRPTATPAGG
jgi:oligopeptide transport system substrate-binding protein